MKSTALLKWTNHPSVTRQLVKRTPSIPFGTKIFSCNETRSNFFFPTVTTFNAFFQRSWFKDWRNSFRIVRPVWKPGYFPRPGYCWNGRAFDEPQPKANYSSSSQTIRKWSYFWNADAGGKCNGDPMFRVTYLFTGLFVQFLFIDPKDVQGVPGGMSIATNLS